MRNALLVASREYVENAKTKGFWIGIFMLPIVLFLSVQVPMLLERKGAPVRHFVLLDYSEQFEGTIDRALERQYQRMTLSRLNEYAREQGVKLPGTLMPFAAETPEAVQKFAEAGGTSTYLTQLRPLLPRGAVEFA